MFIRAYDTHESWLEIKYTEYRYFEPIYMSGVKMQINVKIKNNKVSDKNYYFYYFEQT